MIRRWEEKDTHEVSLIESDSFTDAWSEQSLLQSLKSPAFVGFVFCEQEVAGYVGLICADVAEVALIAVKRQFRRLGIGQKLMLRAIDHAKDAGCEAMLLEVRSSNLPAQGLYKKLGFAPLAIRKNYYSDGEDAIVMSLALK